MSVPNLRKLIKEGKARDVLVFLAEEKLGYSRQLGRVVVDPNVLKSVQASQDRLNELGLLTTEQIKKRCEEYNEEIASYKPLEKEQAAAWNESVDLIIDAIKPLYENLWQSRENKADWRNDDATMYLDEALGAIESAEESLMGMYELEESPLKQLSPEEWHAKALKDAAAEHAAQILRLEMEIKKTNASNDALEELRRANI